MASYTIDSIAQSSQLGANGQLQDVAVVTFITDMGDTGAVRVPLTGDWQAAAIDEVARLAAAYDAIRGSGTGTAPPPA